MVWSCAHCGTVMKLWSVRCPNCRTSGLSWLQLGVIAAIALPALFFVAKMF
jgi:RNA polymerase subunit RPABC4/transcription elongation factor Spt4